MTKEDDLNYLENMDNEPEAEEPEIEANSTEEPEGTEVEVEEVEGEEPEVEVSEEDKTATKGGKLEGEEPEPAQRKRAENRVQKLANERNAEREARIRAEAERDTLLRIKNTAPAIDNSEAIRLRNEKLALMEPHEKSLFLQNERLEQVQQQLLISELKSEDRADKAAYDAKALVDPRYARYKDSVENKLKDYRSKGVNPSRQEIFHLVLGEAIANQKPKKTAREAASQRVSSVQGKPTTAKGNSGGSAAKGDDLSALEARLKGKSFNAMFNN